MGPITNYELGKIQHREYEAEASRYWGQEASRRARPGLVQPHKLVLTLGGITLTVFLLVQFMI